jgi:predicted protein tyrosine phosphatase
MTRVLFICAKNKLRSPTAEHVFASYPDVETDSAGVNQDAEVPVSAEQLRWADVIVVMESRHQAKLRRGFSEALKGKRIICLDIPDNFGYMDPKLIDLLNRRATRFLADR